MKTYFINIRIRALAAILLFSGTSATVSAATFNVTTSATYTAKVTAASEYILSDGVTVTFAIPNSPGAAGSVFASSNPAVGFSVHPATAGGTGYAYFVGSGSASDPSAGTFVTTQHGGAIFARSCTISINNASFTNYWDTNQGGALYAGTNSGYTTVTGVQLSNVTFANNVAAVGGGAMFFGTGAVASLQNIVFSNNRADGFEGRTSGAFGAGFGGGLYILSDTFAPAKLYGSNLVFNGNVAQGTNGRGGAIYARIGQTYLLDPVFTNNIAGNYGGAIALDTGHILTIDVSKDAAYAGNKAYGLTTGSITATSTLVPGLGGFLNMANDNTVVNFNIASGKTLVIGSATNVLADTFATSGKGFVNVNVAGSGSLAAGTAVGTLVLNGTSSSFSGTIVVGAGSLLLGNNSAAQAGRYIINPGATFGGAGSVLGASYVSGTGGATIFVGTGSGGLLTFGTAGVTPNYNTNGLLLLNSNTLTGSGTLGGAISVGGPLIANITGTTQPLVVVATLSSTGAINKIGDGTLAFASNNSSYKAPIAVNGGAIRMDATGTLGSSVTINSGGAIAISATSGVPTITGTLTLATGASIKYDNGAKAVSVNTLSVAGGNTVALTKLISGTYTLFNTTNNITDAVGTAFVTTYKDSAITPRTTATYTGQGAKALQLVVAVTSATRTWTGAFGNTWNSTGTNWAEAEKFYQDGDTVVFSGAGSSTPITIRDAGVIVSDMLVGNTSGTYTFAGGSITGDPASWQGGTVGSTGKLSKTGAGTLAFSNTVNNFQGGIDISAGAISFTSGSQIGTRNAAGLNQGITFSGNSIIIAASDSIAINNIIKVNAGVTGIIDTQGYTLTSSGTFTAAGAGATLQKIGTGTLKLTGDSAVYTGSTSITAGTLYLDTIGKLGGNIAISSGATLAGSGTATGNVSVGPGACIRVGDTDPSATPQKLSITGTLDLNNAFLGLKTNSSGNDSINAGKVNFIGTNIVDFYDMPGVSNTYTLIKTTSGITGVTGNNIVIYNEGVAFTRFGRVDIDFHVQNNDLLLTLLYHNGSLIWSGGIDNVWRSNHENWVGDDTFFLGGDKVTFNGVADTAHPANRVITVSDNDVYVASMNIVGSANYTFTGGAIHSTAATTLTGTNADMRLNMNGTGLVTLLNNTANTYDGGIAINSGTIAGNTTSLGANAVAIAAPGTLIITQTMNGDYAGTVTGQGIVNKQGASTIGLAAAGTIAAKTFNVNEGTFAMRAGALSGNTVNVSGTSTFSYNGGVINVSTFNLNQGALFTSTSNNLTLTAATFNHAGELRIGVAASGTAASTANLRRALTISGNYVGQGGTLVLSTDLVTFDTDRLNITGDASGTTFVNILYTGTTAGSPTTGKGIEIVSVGGKDTLDLELTNRVLAGPYDYLIYHDTGGIYLRSIVSREVTAANAAPAIAVLAGRASLDTVQNRLGELRFDSEKLAGLWVRDTYRRDTLQKGWLSDIDVDTNVIQTGYDHAYIHPGNTPHNFIVGAYFAHTATKGEMPGGVSKLDMIANGGGVYAIYKRDQFYAEALVRGDYFKDTVTAPYSYQNMNGTIVGGSLEAGYEIPLPGRLGTLEPQAQVVLDYVKIQSGHDNLWRSYTFDSMPGPSVRGGLRWHNDCRLGKLGVFTPWIRASWDYDAKAQYTTTVAYSLLPVGVMNQTQTFDNSLRGQRFIFDAGFSWQLASRWALYAGGMYETGPQSESWAGSGGIRFMW